jgi:hypothetical protein
MGPATAIPLPRRDDMGSLQAVPAILRRRMASLPLHRPGRLEPTLLAAFALAALTVPVSTVWLAALAGVATVAAVRMPRPTPRPQAPRTRVPQPAPTPILSLRARP